MMLSSVVLPEPEGPVTTVNSPWSMTRSTPRSATTSVLPSWYDFLMPDSSMRCAMEVPSS